MVTTEGGKKKITIKASEEDQIPDKAKPE